MGYFNNFPFAYYKFGNNTTFDLFQDLTPYVDIIDQFKDQVGAYRTVTILEGDRPDVLSEKLYNNPNLYWTFFLLNDKLRESGWPLTNIELTNIAQRDYPNTTLITRDEIFNSFDVGQTVIGVLSGATGVVLRKRVDFGQIIIETSDTFIQDEIIYTVNGGGATESATLTSVVEEYNATHHYENEDGEYVDVDPFDPDPALLTQVTFLDRYLASNEDLRDIKVFNNNVISQVNKAFQKILRT